MSPLSAPRVPHDPVVLAAILVGSVADSDHTVVELGAAPVHNTRVIELHVGSAHCNGDRLLVDGSLERLLVLRDVLIARDGDHSAVITLDAGVWGGINALMREARGLQCYFGLVIRKLNLFLASVRFTSY